MNPKALLLLGLLLGALSFCPACAHWSNVPFPFDFNRFKDQPIPEDVAPWLKGGEQSSVTTRIKKVAQKISGDNRRERLFRAMQYVWKVFSYDRRLNTEKFKRTADELFKSRILGGCSDYALAEITLFRALGIPARMVVTANVDWMYQYQQDRLSMTEGHSFIEVFLEDSWYLVDSTYRLFFTHYNPALGSYPHGEYFCGRGRDFWDMGLRSGQDLDRMLGEQALNYGRGFKEPSYPRYPI